MRFTKERAGVLACTCLALVGCKSPGGDVELGRISPPGGRFLKHRIAVLPFRDLEHRAGLAPAATDMLVTELFKTERFVMIERDRLGEVIKEQEREGIVSAETLAEQGRVLGAQLFFMGSITNFNLTEIDQPGPIPGSPVSITFKKKHVDVSLDGRVVDTTSAKLVFAGVGKSSRDESNVSLGGRSERRQEAYGQLVRHAVHDLVTTLVAQLDARRWSGYVADLDAEGVYVGGGQDVNMSQGDRFEVIHRERPIHDQGTGLLIGYREQPVGTIEVVSVQDQMSIARKLEGGEIQIGDVVRAASAGRQGADVTPAAAKDTKPAASETKKSLCKSCGLDLAAGAKFCGACGTANP